jgi:isoaspartyl peptidase/L-asparaginase-like protein (Ntn-hydrolase superfamily)
MILVAGDMENSGTALAWDALQAGAPALDAIVQGICAVEANPDDHSVGLGGYPNAAGVVELDAGVMDGRTRASGAVGALTGFAHPVRVARAVMERLPHVMLVGEGAARFAAEIGAARVDLLTDFARDAWARWVQRHDLDPSSPDPDKLREAVWSGDDPWHVGGTTVYLAQDADGEIAAATSTSGWAWKYPGRLGDSPVAGAGFYADSRHGAAACTGMGELAIRTSLARTTVLYMQMGKPVEAAVREALSAVLDLPGWRSNVTLYAIDARGRHYVAATQPGSLGRYYVATDNMPQPEPRDVHVAGG